MPILIETQAVSVGNLERFLDKVEDCWKCASLLWMQANNFPVLAGLIVDGWTRESESAISQFCRTRGFSELLVRLEKRGQRWTLRRGGYTIPLSEVRHQVEELAANGLIAILLEPVSPYSDVFSLSSVYDLGTGNVDVEVVGGGFDASDLLRADSVPHERFQVNLGSSEQGPIASSFRAKRLHVVRTDDYRAAVQRRLVKIGARLRNPSFPNSVIETNVSDADRKHLVEEAARFLRASGQTTLLDHSEEYEPISPMLLKVFLAELSRLVERVRASKIHWRALSLSASFLPKDRLVMWDFFPVGERNTSALRWL